MKSFQTNPKIYMPPMVRDVETPRRINYVRRTPKGGFLLILKRSVMKKTVASLTARPEPQQPETPQSIINPDIVRYTRQLGEIADWFTDYGKMVKPADDHINERLTSISNLLDEAAQNMAELLAIEFLQNVYYKEV